MAKKKKLHKIFGDPKLYANVISADKNFIKSLADGAFTSSNKQVIETLSNHPMCKK